MPLDLASLIDRLAEVSVPYAGEQIRVIYRPAEVTGEAQRVVAQSGADPDPVFGVLERVVADWDLVSNGRPIPISQEGFRAIGFGVTLAILRGVLTDVLNPTWTRTARTPSSNGSSPTASWDRPPTTSTSSSAPGGPASHPGPSTDSTAPPGVSAGVGGSVG
ncbi:MAG TPA: hypothetical protein VG370_34995 [Chloroflexota bacterium]|jgi:hypothetical protein|nr:hypothetical protein [Chloroflexota bacterium]